VSRFRADLERRRRGADGFTLIEVLVAIAIFALFTTAVVPLLITALRASSVAKLDTGARNIGQERLEKMRTLPFHTPEASGAGKDLLDTYFPTVSTAAASVDSAGFVAAGAARKTGEPSGAFYRYLVPAGEIAPSAATAETFSRYTQRVATQFLNASGSPFAPASWNALVSPGDEAVPSFIVRATVTTTWKAGALSKSYTVSTNIGEGRSAPAVARGEVRATALRVTSAVPDPTTLELSDLLFEAASVTMDGSVGRGAKVAASARGALASLVPGSRIEGASGGATSPTNGSIAGGTTPAPASPLMLGTKELVRFGETSLSGATTSADGGQMRAGTAAAPVTAAVSSGSAVRFTNLPDLDTGGLQLRGDLPVVFRDGDSDLFSETDTGKPVEASGRLASVGTSNHSVSAAATAKTPSFAIVPTAFAPRGLLRVELQEASLSCSAGVSSTAPTLTYKAKVRYWGFDTTKGKYDYLGPITLTQAETTDKLAALMSVQVGVKADGTTPLTYANYFTKLGSATASSLAAERTVTAAGHTANHTGLLTISTVSLRKGYESPVTARFGVLSCALEDAR
jgi:prepilin-type N-terminal cleavage/methylation domain-containing protein